MLTFSSLLLAPLRVGVPFFNIKSFRPKTKLKVTNKTLVTELKNRLGSDIYKNSTFVRRHNDFLIVSNNKVCGVYSPVLCLPPPLPHTAMAREDMAIKGGLSVSQYLECLTSLDDDYRSFLFYSMHHGCIFCTFDQKGNVPASSKIGIQYFRTRQFSEERARQEGCEDNNQHFKDDEGFVRRYTPSVSGTSLSIHTRVVSDADLGQATLSEDLMMQAGFHSSLYRDILQILSQSYSEEIDVCPTWWRRSAVKAGMVEENVLRRLGSVARSLSRPVDAQELDEVDSSCPPSQPPPFQMDLTDDKRWVSCPTQNFSPYRILSSDGTLDESRLLSRTREGYLLLDF